MLVLESPIELHLNQSQKSSFIEDRQYFSLANTKVVMIWYEQHTYACKPREKKSVNATVYVKCSKHHQPHERFVLHTLFIMQAVKAT